MADALAVRREYRLQEWVKIVELCRESGEEQPGVLPENGNPERPFSTASASSERQRSHSQQIWWNLRARQLPKGICCASSTGELALRCRKT